MKFYKCKRYISPKELHRDSLVGLRCHHLFSLYYISLSCMECLVGLLQRHHVTLLFTDILTYQKCLTGHRKWSLAGRLSLPLVLWSLSFPFNFIPDARALGTVAIVLCNSFCYSFPKEYIWLGLMYAVVLAQILFFLVCQHIPIWYYKC